MPSSPALTLVHPRAQHRTFLRQRLVSGSIGVLIAVASAIPFVVTLGR